MINFDDYANKNKTEHHLKWPYIPNTPCRRLIIGGSGSGKQMHQGYSSIILEAKKRAAEEKVEQGGAGLKILSPKQLRQRLPIALAQVKASNNSESLLTEIRKIAYSLHQSKEITKKVYNNIIKSIQL